MLHFAHTAMILSYAGSFHWNNFTLRFAGIDITLGSDRKEHRIKGSDRIEDKKKKKRVKKKIGNGGFGCTIYVE